MTILGIETSCDETAAAVVRDGCLVLSNVVYTQIPLHRPYGGVVPEIASRAHVEKISEVVGEAIAKYKALEPTGSIDAVAVTYGPGLSPALLVGLNAAKGLAFSLRVPLICINHMEAHLHTPFLKEPADGVAPNPQAILAQMPALGLAVSGGHTCWIDMPEYGVYQTIGQTLDDAAGEAFDKAAKLLELGYPGGPVVDRLAKDYLATHPKPDFIPFPKGRPRDGVTALVGLPAELCVSFSGLKTALLHYVQRAGGTATLQATGEISHVVASYQEAIVNVLADRTRIALRRRPYKALIVGGGVSLNSRLRAALQRVADEAKIPLLMAKPKFCGDNGAMIAGIAYFRQSITAEDAWHTDVSPSLEIPLNA